MSLLSGAKRDSDGYLWITGRIDDMLNVSGHLLSTADVESVLIEHPLVAETAVVAHPHSIKGECLYCFVTVKDVSLSVSASRSTLGRRQRHHVFGMHAVCPWFCRVCGLHCFNSSGAMVTCGVYTSIPCH